jgi:hypothetical protein
MLPKTNSQKERNKMSDSIAPMMAPVELTDLELDAVAGGQRPQLPGGLQGNQFAGGGLVNANVNVSDIQVGVAAQIIGENLEQTLEQ